MKSVVPKGLIALIFVSTIVLYQNCDSYVAPIEEENLEQSSLSTFEDTNGQTLNMPNNYTDLAGTWSSTDGAQRSDPYNRNCSFQLVISASTGFFNINAVNVTCPGSSYSLPIPLYFRVIDTQLIDQQGHVAGEINITRRNRMYNGRAMLSGTFQVYPSAQTNGLKFRGGFDGKLYVSIIDSSKGPDYDPHTGNNFEYIAGLEPN